MRVIAGCAKGQKLIAPEGLQTRPTADQVKEALFSMMAFDLPACDRFLDLFAGSGAIGIEALSRGVGYAVFVEESLSASAVIQENLRRTKLMEAASVMTQDVLGALAKLSMQQEAFSIIFLDPPYQAELTEEVLSAVVSGGLLQSDGFIVAEHSAKTPIKPVAGLRQWKTKKYKTAGITFLSLEE